MLPGTVEHRVGLTRPASSAAAIVTTLLVEPGSKTSVSGPVAVDVPAAARAGRRSSRRRRSPSRGCRRSGRRRRSPCRPWRRRSRPAPTSTRSTSYWIDWSIVSTRSRHARGARHGAAAAGISLPCGSRSTVALCPGAPGQRPVVRRPRARRGRRCRCRRSRAPARRARPPGRSASTRARSRRRRGRARAPVARRRRSTLRATYTNARSRLRQLRGERGCVDADDRREPRGVRVRVLDQARVGEDRLARATESARSSPLRSKMPPRSAGEGDASGRAGSARGAR